MRNRYSVQWWSWAAGWQECRRRWWFRSARRCLFRRAAHPLACGNWQIVDLKTGYVLFRLQALPAAALTGGWGTVTKPGDPPQGWDKGGGL